MAVEEKQVLLGFKIDERQKRRFDAAMRGEGTTISEQLRRAISRFLDDLDAGVTNPQIKLDLQDKKSK